MLGECAAPVEEWQESLLKALCAVPDDVIGLHTVIDSGVDVDFSRTLDTQKTPYALYPSSIVSIDFQAIFVAHAKGLPIYADRRERFMADTALILERIILVWQSILNEIYSRHFKPDGAPQDWFKTAIEDYLRGKADEAGKIINLEDFWENQTFKNFLLCMLIMAVPTYLADAYS